jgi:hypothetical protein
MLWVLLGNEKTRLATGLFIAGLRWGLGVLDDQVVGEAEVHDGLGGDDDVAVAGGPGDECSGTGTGCAADGEAYAAGGDSADEHAGTRHAADEAGGALAFALLGADVVMGVEGVLVAVEGHGDEAEFEDGTSLEVAAAMRFVDAPCNVSAGRDDDCAVAAYRLDDFAGEAVAGVGVLDADALVDADGELSAGGDCEVDGRRRLCRSAGGVGGWTDGLAADAYGSDDRLGALWGGGTLRRRCGGGCNLLGLACGGWGLNGGGDGVAALIDVLDLLGGVGGGGCGLGLVERLVLLGLAAGEQGEGDESGACQEARLCRMS